MHLNRIVLRNLRGFDGASRALDLELARPDDAHAGWTGIAGRNGAGKSTVLGVDRTHSDRSEDLHDELAHPEVFTWR